MNVQLCVCLCCTRVEESGRTTSVSNLLNQYCVCSQNRFGLFTQCCLYPSHACYFHILTFLLSLSLMGRSLVEDDDAQMMKVSLGCSEMGLSSHLQASKTGNTRFFTSNTHSSVVLQVSVCVRLHMSLTKCQGGYVGCHHLPFRHHITR